MTLIRLMTFSDSEAVQTQTLFSDTHSLVTKAYLIGPGSGALTLLVVWPAEPAHRTPSLVGSKLKRLSSRARHWTSKTVDILAS